MPVEHRAGSHFESCWRVAGGSCASELLPDGPSPTGAGKAVPRGTVGGNVAGRGEWVREVAGGDQSAEKEDPIPWRLLVEQLLVEGSGDGNLFSETS